MYKLLLPDELEYFHLSICSAKRIQNEAIRYLATVIPQKLEILELHVSGFKTLNGLYLPQHNNDNPQSLALNMTTKENIPLD